MTTNVVPKIPIRFASLLPMAIALVAASHVLAAPASGPCRQIVDACQQAGFTRGDARSGAGLQVHCVIPIVQGTAQPRRATKPLPQIDPQLVAACKASMPAIGQRKAAPQKNNPLASPPPP